MTAGSHSVVNLAEIASAGFVQVNTFADLPTAALFPGEIYIVKSPTGFMITLNLKRAGLYLSNGSVWTRLGTLQDQFSTDKFVIYDDADNTKKLVVDLTNLTTGITRTIIMADVDVDLANVHPPDIQALVNNRKVAPQLVTTSSAEADNIITFPVPNPAPTDSAVIDFDGTILSILERHPLNFSELNAFFVLENSHNSGVNVTINFRVSTDGGTTFPTIVNSETFSMLPKSGSSSSTVFPTMNEWISPQPSSVPVFLKVQVFASVTNVVSVSAGSIFSVKGFSQ